VGGESNKRDRQFSYILVNVGQDSSQYSDLLHAGRSRDLIPIGARFSATVQTGPGAHPASYTMGTGSLPGGYVARVWH